MQIISEVNTTNLIVLSLFSFSRSRRICLFQASFFTLQRATQNQLSGKFLLTIFRCNPQRPHSSSDWFSSCFPQKPHNQSYVWGETTDNLNKFREETHTYKHASILIHLIPNQVHFKGFHRHGLSAAVKYRTWEKANTFFSGLLFPLVFGPTARDASRNMCFG